MKKFVTALLAVLLTVGVCAVSVVAEEPSEGVTYTNNDIVRIATENNDADEQVTVLKPGDIVKFNTKTKKVELYFYPDAVTIDNELIVNNTWKTYIESLGTVSLFATSTNKYKYFYSKQTYSSSTSVSIPAPAFNSEDYKYAARDGSDYEWGVFPIDYALKFTNGIDAEFLGWVVKEYSNKTTATSLVLYAYWDRSNSGETTTTTTTTQPATTDPDYENKSDIMKTLSDFFRLISENNGYDTDDWRYYLSFLPKVPSALFGAIVLFLTNGTFLQKVYDYFGIVVE